MIVRAERIRTSARGPELLSHSALRVGTDYLVLELHCGSPAMYRILDDENDPTLWPADCFQIVDGTLARSWTVRALAGGSLILAPRRWQHPEFWEGVLEGPTGNEFQSAFVDELNALRLSSGD